MPIPKPHKDEKKDDFQDRCMNDPTMKRENPDNKQRFAICQDAWDDRPKNLLKHAIRQAIHDSQNQKS